MRVALLNTLDVGGGAERAVNDLADALTRAGHQPTLFCRHVAQPARKTPYPVVHLAEPGCRSTHPEMALLEAGDELRRRFDGFDAVHVHDVQGDRRQPVAVAALHWVSRHVPTFWTLHNFWPVTGGCPFPGNCERFGDGCGDCPQVGSPLIGDVDHTAAWYDVKRRAWRESRVTPITPSRWAAAQADKVLGPLDIRTRVIVHGANLQRFKPQRSPELRKQLGFFNDRPVVLFLQNCATDERKRPEFIVQLADAARGAVQLLIVGQNAPAFANTLNKQTPAAGVDYVEDAARLAELYSIADLTLQPSENETFGLTMIESQACGTPACAKAVCAFPEIIAPDRTGWLLPPGASPTAVLELLAGAWPSRIEVMRDQCRQGAVERFDINRCAAEHAALYAAPPAPRPIDGDHQSFSITEAAQLALVSAGNGHRTIDLAALADAQQSAAPRFRRRYLRALWQSLAADGKPLAIFGAGKHTRWLLDLVGDLAAPQQLVILDDNAAPGDAVGRCAVTRPEPNRPPCRRILLSSDVHEAALERRCRELYGGAVEIVAPYAGLPAGPYD